MVQSILPVFFVIRQIGGSVFQDRLFTQIVGDHFRHEIINAFVIRHPVAGSVYHSHVTCPVGVHNVRNTDQGRRLEAKGIHILVADPAVHRAHTDRVAAGTIIQGLVLYKQVAAFCQHGPGLFRQIGVFKVGCVVTARRKNYVNAAGVHVIHGPFQQGTILTVVPDMVAFKSFRTAATAQGPRNQRIGSAGRNPQVIFQNIPFVVLTFYQVDAGNMAVHIF